MTAPVRQDLDAPYWTIEQAALHFGITRAGVRKMIREGLPVYFAGTLLKPSEYVTFRLERQARQQATRIRPRHAQHSDDGR